MVVIDVGNDQWEGSIVEMIDYDENDDEENDDDNNNGDNDYEEHDNSDESKGKDKNKDIIQIGI